jgi:hypothetical protein
MNIQKHNAKNGRIGFWSKTFLSSDMQRSHLVKWLLNGILKPTGICDSDGENYVDEKRFEYL